MKHTSGVILGSQYLSSESSPIDQGHCSVDCFIIHSILSHLLAEKPQIAECFIRLLADRYLDKIGLRCIKQAE